MPKSGNFSPAFLGSLTPATTITRNENSPTVQILRFLANGNIVPVYSEDIVKEYNEVLRRAKFKLSESLIINLLKDIMDNGLKITELAEVTETMPDREIVKCCG